MHDFLEELRSIYDQIAKTQTGRLSPGLTADEVVSSLREVRDTLATLHRRTESIINNCLYPMLEEITAISGADEEDLYKTAQSISSYKLRADPGLALKMYQALLEWARHNQDDAGKIKYLYWCGITQYYLQREEKQKFLDYFKEGASYARKYDSFENPETRSYIHRCLGNTSMVYYSIGNALKAEAVDESSFSFWNSLIFAGKDPDFPWLTYFLTCLTHRHNNLTKTVHNDPDSETKEGLRKILETAITINKLYHRNCESFSHHGGTRYDFMLWEAQFLNGLISFDMLFDNICKRKAQFSHDDISTDAVFAKHDLNSYLVFYVTSMQKLKSKKDSILAMVSADAIEYFSNIPKTANPREVALQLVGSAKGISFAFEPVRQLEFVMQMSTFRHIPTYAHSIVVGKIASCLTEYLVRKNPGIFIGCLGIEDEAQARSRKDELCGFANTSGLCHDIGKISYITNPYIHARDLTEEESDLIKRHPEDGKTMLSRSDESTQNEGYIDVILGHHKYYDNNGGYPDDFDIHASKYKALIDIIAVADSIDAATDDITKSYSNPVSLDEICREIAEHSGSRYSPESAAALKDGEVRKSLEAILSSGRKEAYHTAYSYNAS